MDKEIKNRLFGIKKTTLIANAAGFLALVLITYPLHFKPIKNQLIATYKVADMSQLLQQEGLAYFAMEPNLGYRSLSQSFKCTNTCDVNLAEFQKLIDVSGIEIPYIEFEKNSWGYALAASNYVLTGLYEPKLINFNDVDLQLTRDRADAVKNKIFFNLFK
ncbi:hypothetical protein [Cellvibrio sp. QJXJ]|uniref:hypothetical protein n=1 Tax=Cellvibrio sp. QJXJ TaxID=2964606 RepID=UPI0021C3A2ED|nr:hypothetical protein [Cellvibrio sp. QJXJ]UUA75225.1 hypothetical protein NNX04_22465 [Cellvibrio sp. QJXJ]